MKKFEKIGVIGAGTIGIGVAQDLAQAGLRVVLLDVSAEKLIESRQRMIQNIRSRFLFGKTSQKLSTDAVLDQITFTTESATLRDVDFVVENVTENWEIKSDLYKELDRICQLEVVFAANTSAIPITKIASLTARAPQVLGMHFMNPVPSKRMVEVIRGFHTSEETLERAKALLLALDKECVVVNDSPGFVSNRVLMLTVNEAIFVVQEQVASVEQVDKIFRECFGHQMGPLETADLIGLDTILFSLEVLQENFGDDKYRPCVLLRKMVHAGLYGRKSGRGFYSYE
jgi:3-hydroxybutyryl-CoA dehydrogenase